MATQQKYIPGVCNIGPAEIRRRRQSGYVGLGVAIGLWVVLIWLRAPAYLRLLVFFPVTAAASGFIQAWWHFCAGFGMRGVFNFGAEVGRTDTVEQAEFRARDRRKSQQILAYSVLVGLVVAIGAWL